MDSDVSLEEILNVLGEPIDERAAWALLVQAYDALQRWIGKSYVVIELCYLATEQSIFKI